MWLTFLAGLMQFLGPILADAFRAWLEAALKRAAEKMDAEHLPYFGQRTNQIDLLKRVRDGLWFWQVGKKRAVDSCIEAVKSGSTKWFGVISD